MPSVGGDQGLPCARYSWFQPAPQWTHWRPKLSPTAKHVVPVKTFRKVQRSRRDGTRERGNTKVIDVWDVPWRTRYAPKRTAAHGWVYARGGTPLKTLQPVTDTCQSIRNKQEGKRGREKLLHPDPDHLRQPLHHWREWMWPVVITS